MLLIGAGASARPQPWIGTLDFVMPGLAEAELDGGGGVAWLNDTGVQLETVALGGGLSGATILPVTDPVVSNGGIVSIRVTAALGSGELRIDPAGTFGGPAVTAGSLPLPGVLRLCLYAAGCGSALSLPLTRPTVNGVAGVGVGGLLTVGGLGAIRLSVLGAPWTLNTASVHAETPGGASTTLFAFGFVHGPLSFTGSGAASASGQGGAIQLVTPIRVTSLPGVGSQSAFGGFARLTLHFVPEPAPGLLLGGGALALILAGRSRRARRS